MSSPQFVFRRSDGPNGAWVLYAPGTRDEAIASGKAEPLLTGTAAWDLDVGMWTRPNGKDYRAAKDLYYEREGIEPDPSRRPAPHVCKVCEREVPRERLDVHRVCLGCRITGDADVARYHAERARRWPELYPAGFVVA